MKLFLAPQITRPDKADGGIRRVIDAQVKYLPEFGVELVSDIANADITAGHVDHIPLKQGAPFVSHNHGLYWSEYQWDDWHYSVNKEIVNGLVQAQAFTTPSRWVAQAISYGLLRTPHVIYHGIDTDEWKPKRESGGYVLWNKARADAVSNPDDLDKVATRLPQIKFITTIGKQTKNVSQCGVVNYKRMQEYVRGAGVYLATARETFGIGTLEALASGVPVAGWDYGGQSEIISQGETGYLAPYGNYDALADCINKCFDERARLSANARADAIARWQWRDKIAQYAALYKNVLDDWRKPRPKVSVIVTCHNLAKFLPDALNSVVQQTIPDWECLIVDDDSKDETPNIAQRYASQDKRIRYLQTPENLKLSRALNFGHSHARGKYFINLDADNLLPDDTLAILSNALDTRRDLHIVYGGLDTISEDGTNRKPNLFPYPAFSWYGQIAHQNQLHSSAMMRREVIEQSGGYRERQFRAEDAELWTRISSFGFRIARVTDKPTLIYRWRTDSKSMLESRAHTDKDGDWCEFFPWRTARTAQDGGKVLEKNPRAYANASLVPIGAQGERTDKPFWDVWHRQEPLVSVIIPVGKGHRERVCDALDSLVGQTMNEWEVVTVNDSGEEWSSIAGAPYARVIQNTTGKHGAGIARNLGIDNARAPFVYFLDADDMLQPDALTKLIKRYVLGDTGYVYSDARVPTSPTEYKYVPELEYQQIAWSKRGLHTQGVLMTTADARAIRFDEELPAWEDWDFFVRCAVSGICGARYPEALLTYRKHLGNRSKIDANTERYLKGLLHERYNAYVQGAKQMSPCGGCGKNSDALRAAQRSRTVQTNVTALDQPVKPGHVRMRYIGAYRAPVNFYANGHAYPAAQTEKWRFLDVLEADVERLLATSQFIALSGVAPLAQPVAVAPPVAPVAAKPIEVIVVKSEPQTVKVETVKPVAPVAPVDKRVAVVEIAPAKRGRKPKAK